MKIGQIIRKLLLVVSVLMIITSSVQGTMAFLVAKTDTITNIFIPVNFGGLILDKGVEHPLGDGYTIPNTVSFDFEISLGGGYAGKKVDTNYGSYNADSRGAFTVSVRPGASLVITDLTEGTPVTVTEISTLPGFTPKDNVTVRSATVGADGNVKIDFVNVYDPESVTAQNLTLKGKKTLEGRDWQSGDEFTFILEQKNGENWSELGKATVTYDENNADFDKFDLTDKINTLVFDTVGTYSFRIYEQKGDLDRVDYDETVNEFKIVVTDADMDGFLEIKTVSATQNATAAENSLKNGYDIFVEFNNTFVPPPPPPEDITVTVSAVKTLTGAGAGSYKPDMFKFLLSEKDGENLSLYAVGGSADFVLTFTAEDIGKTYEYTLSEVKNSIQGVTYSEKIYNISIAITKSDDNKLIATVISGGETVTEPEFEFVNVCDGKTPGTGDDNALIFWGVIFVIGVVMFTTLVFTEKRRTVR